MKTLTLLKKNLVCDFGNAVDWSKPNKTKIHYGKNTCMLLGTRQRLNLSRKLNIPIEKNCIHNVAKQKLLGIYIDETMTWSTHIDHLCSIIASKISLLRQLSEYVPVETPKLFYQGYILPFIDYGSAIWGSAAGVHIERLSNV